MNWEKIESLKNLKTLSDKEKKSFSNFIESECLKFWTNAFTNESHKDFKLIKEIEILDNGECSIKGLRDKCFVMSGTYKDVRFLAEFHIWPGNKTIGLNLFKIDSNNKKISLDGGDYPMKKSTLNNTKVRIKALIEHSICFNPKLVA